MSESAPLMNTLESFLRLTVSREKAITANMANVDTPGYRTRDINFQQELNRAVNFSNAEWNGQTGSAELAPTVSEVPGLMERADGNNVDIDRESLVMAETQLQYQMGIQLIKRQFHQILSAINGN
jgi:flagellar basal-body rod protein FlgB